MKVQIVSLLFVLVLLLNDQPAEAWGYYGGGYRRGGYGYGYRGYGRGYRRGGGRGIGRAIVGGAALIGGLALLGALVGKKKRSTDEGFGDTEVEEISPQEQALNYFDMAMELDEDMCMEKALCTIMASSEKQKNPSTLVKILKTIYYGNMPLLGVEGHDEATKLLEAGLLGKTAKTEEVCKIAFKTCKADSETLKKELEDQYQLRQKYQY